MRADTMMKQKEQ